MTKKEIVKTISDLSGLPLKQVKDVVDKMFEALIEALAEERRVELRNFGVFEVKTRRPRHARNPKTGESIPIPARSVVTFKPGKEMEQRVLAVEASKARAARLATPADAPLPPPELPPASPSSS